MSNALVSPGIEVRKGYAKLFAHRHRVRRWHCRRLLLQLMRLYSRRVGEWPLCPHGDFFNYDHFAASLAIRPWSA